MANKPKVTLVATAPDGTEIKVRTSARYDWAGLAQRKDKTCALITKGCAYDSVAARTRRAWRRAGGWTGEYQRGWTVVAFEVAK